MNLIKKAIEKNPRNPAYNNNFGNICKDQGRSEEAISNYKKVLAGYKDKFIG